MRLGKLEFEVVRRLEDWGGEELNAWARTAGSFFAGRRLFSGRLWAVHLVPSRTPRNSWYGVLCTFGLCYMPKLFLLYVI